MELAEKLTLLRENREIYQKELASYLKVSVATISNYEKGIHEPDLVTLCKLADFYDVSTDYLLGRTPIPSPSNRMQPKVNHLEKLFLDLTKLSINNIEVIWLFEKFLQRCELQIKRK